jgi:hypothetical protein
MKLTAQLHLVQRSWMHGTIPSLPNTPSRHGSQLKSTGTTLPFYFTHNLWTSRLIQHSIMYEAETESLNYLGANYFHSHTHCALSSILSFLTYNYVYIQWPYYVILTQWYKSLSLSLLCSTNLNWTIHKLEYLKLTFMTTFMATQPFRTYCLTNYVEYDPYWEGSSCSNSQEILCLLRNPRLHYHVHNSLPLVPILSQMDPVHTLPTCMDLMPCISYLFFH